MSFMERNAPDTGDLVQRAIAAYKRRSALHVISGGYVQEFNGLQHVIVHETGAAIAVYITRTNGCLRRIWRWPDVIW